MNILLNFIKEYWLEFLVGFIGIILGVFVIILAKRLINHIKSKSSRERKTIHFPKVAMWLLFVIMATIVLVSFFVGDPKFSISAGIICVLGLMVFVIFSDSIEDFSIANIVTLKKEVKDKKEQVSKLSSENSELRTQLTSIVSASIHNQNLNNVVLGIGDSFLKYAQVEQATREEVNKSSADEHSAQEHDETSTEDMQKIRKASFLRSRFYAKADQKMLDKFAFINELPPENMQHNVRFAKYLDANDEIMEYRAIFDGYIKRPFEEIFIECSHGIVSIHTYYRFYYMISLILQYARSNKKSAKLVLLVPNIPNEILSQYFNFGHTYSQEKELERLRDNFQPAIQNGFLELVTIDFTEEECISIINSIQTN